MEEKTGGCADAEEDMDHRGSTPDDTLWMIYHANIHFGSGWNGRSCRAQSVQWDGVTLELGTPAIPGEPIPLAVFEEE